MTPQEELFSKFFNHEKILVKDMSTLELRAHRDELSAISFEARARMSAVDEEEKERKSKARKENGPTGFSRSVATDDKTSDAINAVKARQKKMSKEDRIIADMIKIGIPEAEANRIVSAGNMLQRLKMSVNEPVEKNSDKPKIEAKTFVNPFIKKVTE